MSVGQFLIAEEHLTGLWPHRVGGAEERRTRDVLERAGLDPGLAAPVSPGVRLRLTVGFWKDNHVAHELFAEVAGDAVGEPGPTYVPREELRVVHKRAARALAAHYRGGGTDQVLGIQLESLTLTLARVLEAPSLADCDFLYLAG